MISNVCEHAPDKLAQGVFQLGRVTYTILDIDITDFGSKRCNTTTGSLQLTGTTQHADCLHSHSFAGAIICAPKIIFVFPWSEYLPRSKPLSGIPVLISFPNVEDAHLQLHRPFLYTASPSDIAFAGI